MKIRVTTEGKSVAIDMDQVIAEKVFKAIVLQLLQASGLEGDRSVPATGELPPVKIQPKSSIVQEDDETVDKPYKKLDGLHQYKGFLYVKCPECGNIKGFCTKEPMEGFHCFECGADMPFTDKLVPLYVNCQCGRGFKYMTNMADNMFDVNCVECGAPVAVQYNARKKLYETIREDEQ